MKYLFQLVKVSDETYRVVDATLSQHGRSDDFDRFLTSLTEEGWEVVTMCSTATDEVGTRGYMFLLRKPA
jgi:hypothetical protein